MMNRTDELLNFRGSDLYVNQIMDVYSEAAEVHLQALIAMGQQPVAASSPVASTDIVMNLTLGHSSSEERR